MRPYMIEADIGLDSFSKLFPSRDSLLVVFTAFFRFCIALNLELCGVKCTSCFVSFASRNRLTKISPMPSCRQGNVRISLLRDLLSKAGGCVAIGSYSGGRGVSRRGP